MGLLTHGRTLLISGLIIIFTLSGVSAGALSTEAEERSFREYKVKAAYLYNFIKFVEWPSGLFPEQSLKMNICIYGKDPFGDAIDAIGDKTVQGRSLSVRRSASMDQLDGCHVIFVSLSREKYISTLLRRLGNKHILTVSDIDDFAHMGGVIGLVTARGKINVEINLHAAERSGLKVSSKLLKISKVIKQGDQERQE